MDHPCITPPPQESPKMYADRLSDLPDDVLRRILYFAPAREGASTAVLSRRWPGLWATSGAVNLDTRSYDRAHAVGDIFDKRESFLHGAAAALAAAARARGPVRRLAVDVVTESPYEIHAFLHRHADSADEYDMLADVLSNPAAQRVEELRIAAAGSRCELAGDRGNFYELSFGTLPSMALRVLHITNCTDLTPPPPGEVFPLLAELKLLGCTTSVTGLQGMIDAAPQLAGLHLESTRLIGGLEYGGETGDGGLIMIERYRFRCPTITALVLAKCAWPEFLEGSVELDMPMLRYFKYHGIVHQFSLKSKVPNMTRADLHFIDNGFHKYQIRECCVAFWQFVQNFDNAKFLKLELECPIEFIAIDGKKKQQELLAGKLFISNLERLDLEGRYEPASKNTTVAIANLLYCCPVVRDLRIKLSKNPAVDRSVSYIQSFIDSKTRLEFDKSIDHFRRRRRQAMISFGGDNDEGYEVSDIPSLSAHPFNCLQTCTRRVSLQLPLEDRNCFGVQLTKFFAENALVLQEMYIGDGSKKMCEHINRRVKTWIANSSKRKVSASLAGFTVLPLET